MPPSKASTPELIMRPAPGQRWREVDPRVNPPRIVEIVRVDFNNGDAYIKTVGTGLRGAHRTLPAKLSRFHGKRGGYAYCAEDQK